jgi:hypothetical protein
VKLVIVLLVLALAACGSIFHFSGEDPQAVIDKRLVGMSIGDFVQRYGAPLTRNEGPDRSLAITWESAAPKIPAGPRGTEESICSLRVSTDPNGRIVAAPIMRDGRGERLLSLCAEIFSRP